MLNKESHLLLIRDEGEPPEMQVRCLRKTFIISFAETSLDIPYMIVLLHKISFGLRSIFVWLTLMSFILNLTADIKCFEHFKKAIFSF